MIPRIDSRARGCRSPLPYTPFILGIGGTTAPDSSSEKALRVALRHACNLGAEIEIMVSDDLDFPNYRPGGARNERAERLIASLLRCDGLIIATPAYHGVMSGMIKNALDYVEDLRNDERPYLSGRVVGTIVCAYGEQAMGTALTNVRTVIHALRGWPTPLGVSINSAVNRFGSDGLCLDADIDRKLRELARQMVCPVFPRLN